MSSLDLKEALEKFNQNSSIDEIIDGLQKGAYIYGLSAPEKPIFQEYLISLLNCKSAKELKDAITLLQKQLPITGGEIRGSIKYSSEFLSKSIDEFKNLTKTFSDASNNTAKALNLWTKVLAFSTVALVLVTIVSIFN